MAYEAAEGDEIRFTLAAEFQRSFVYRVDSIDQVAGLIDVSTETGFPRDKGDDNRFHYAIEKRVFYSLGPKLASEAGETHAKPAVPLRDDLKASESRRRRVQSASEPYG